jgi:hypothetical protein
MKKNALSKLLNNTIVYYVVLVFAVLNVLGYFSMRSWECIVLFSAVAYSANCYGGNMTVALLAGLFVANFVFGCNRVREGFEEAHSPANKAKKLLKKAEKKALKEGYDASDTLEGADVGDAEKLEGFSIFEGNQNMRMENAANMLKSLGNGQQGADSAAAIEKMINNMGGISGILQAFGGMNKSA